MVKTPHFHYRETGFDPWLGNEDPTCLGETKPHSYWSLHTLEPTLPQKRSTPVRSPGSAARESPLLWATRESP